MSIGERILQLRKSQGISQGEIAKSLAISRQAVSKWENDITSPDALNLIRLADVLDTDVEYLTTGRTSYARRPPVVIQETQIQEKIVEKPVIQIVEKVVEKHVVEYVERPVIQKVYRTKYIRNPIEYVILGGICLLIGILIGLIL